MKKHETPAPPPPDPEPLGPQVSELGQGTPDAELPPPPPEPSIEAPREKRKYRKRRPKEEEPAPAATPLTDQEKVLVRAAFILLFHFGFKQLGKWRGPHWSLSEEEEVSLGEAWAAGVEPYLDSMTAKMTPISAAVLCTAFICLPRIMQDAQASEQRAANPPGTTITAEVQP